MIQDRQASLRVTYRVEELTQPGLVEMLAQFRQVHERGWGGTMNVKDFVSIRDFSASEIEYLLLLARQIKTHPGTYSDTLKGKTLAMIFEKPSLRTG